MYPWLGEGLYGLICPQKSYLVNQNGNHSLPYIWLAPSGESYRGNRIPGRKQWQPTARWMVYVTCGLTACIPGSAQGPMLSNEFVRTLT